MGRRQQHVYRLEPPQFPADFPERLDEFRRAAGLSWRELARLLQVNVRSVHRWRKGARPDAGRLVALLELAAQLDLLDRLFPNMTTRERTRNGGPRSSHCAPRWVAAPRAPLSDSHHLGSSDAYPRRQRHAPIAGAAK